MYGNKMKSHCLYIYIVIFIFSVFIPKRMVLKLQLEIIVRSIKEISQKYIRVQQKYSNTNMFKHCCNIMNVDLIHLKRTFQGFVMCFFFYHWSYGGELDRFYARLYLV